MGLTADKYLFRAVDKTLSGGERKRIELAGILAMRPKLILMDEPDSGIDADALDHVFDALRMLRQRGTTVVMITHSLTVLRRADHAFLMCSGRLVDKGSVSKIAGHFEQKNAFPANTRMLRRRSRNYVARISQSIRIAWPDREIRTAKRVHASQKSRRNSPTSTVRCPGPANLYAPFGWADLPIPPPERVVKNRWTKTVDTIHVNGRQRLDE